LALSKQGLIRAATIDDRERDFKQSEIDRPLTAMVVPGVQYLDRSSHIHGLVVVAPFPWSPGLDGLLINII